MAHNTYSREAASNRLAAVAFSGESTIEGLNYTTLNLSKSQRRQVKQLRRAFRSVK